MNTDRASAEAEAVSKAAKWAGTSPPKSLIVLLGAAVVLGCLGITLSFVRPRDNHLITATELIRSPVCGTWFHATGPGLGGSRSMLSDVLAFGPREAWAVGARQDTLSIPGTNQILLVGSGMYPYTLHWNGVEWREVDFASIQTLHAELRAVAGSSANGLFAVGSSYPEDGYEQALIAHWNGSRWLRMESPEIGAIRSALNDVAVLGADAWVVGRRGEGPFTLPLLLHWDGQSWEQIKQLPVDGSKATSNELFAVLAISPTDVWAVGSSYHGDRYEPLSLHWDGAAWERVQIPETDESWYFTSIAAVSADEVWAAGTDGLTARWNGDQWDIYSTPWAGKGGHLKAIAVLSSTSVWALGGTTSGTGPAVVVRWDGHMWSEVPGTVLRAGDVYQSVTKLTDEQLLAVGGTLPGIERGPWYSFVTAFEEVPCSTGIVLP